jgi:signal transduction histidine kinase
VTAGVVQRLGSVLLDAALVLVFVALLVDRQFLGLGTVTDIAGDPVWTFPLFLAGDLALLWRRRFPVAVAVVAFVPYALHAVVTGAGVEGAFALLPGLVALYSLGAYAVGRQLAVGVAVVGALEAVHDTHDPGIRLSNEVEVWSYLFWTAVLVGVLVVGVLVGTRRRAEESRRRAAEAEARRVEAVASERAKIARELHDVVTHNVNVVVMQAMAANGVLDSDPARVRAPLEAIETSGREALAEMRRMLGVLRQEDDLLLAPQPDAAEVGRLADSLNAAGHRVECRVADDLGPLPDGMGLVVFRIVQEALTNTVKHARGAAARVEVRRTPDAVEVEVVNGPGVPETERSGAGHGLVGMSERAALFGGTLACRPTEDGGFRVFARLPLEPA